MIYVKIGNLEKNIQDIRADWINETIERMRRDGIPVCVQVRIERNSLNMHLSSPNCGAGGGGRPPNSEELQIFKLWEKHHLSTNNFTGGDLIAFLKQIT